MSEAELAHHFSELDEKKRTALLKRIKKFAGIDIAVALQAEPLAVTWGFSVLQICRCRYLSNDELVWHVEMALGSRHIAAIVARRWRDILAIRAGCRLTDVERRSASRKALRARPKSPPPSYDSLFGEK